MTNLQIINGVKSKLVADGIISVDDEIHTYGMWKKLGYQVLRGEKAVAKFSIWQYYSNKEKEKEAEEDTPPTDKMRMRYSYFFSSKQVEALD